MKIVGKMEDEVPAFFKRMRYPFAISKSALFAVGSPHTWPGLLAALVWLTDLLYYAEKAVSSLLGFLLWSPSDARDLLSLITHDSGNHRAPAGNALLLKLFQRSKGYDHSMQARLQDPKGLTSMFKVQEHVREETFDETAKQEADFFSYIATSYKHYLNGDDEECARVDGEQRQAFEEKAQAAESQVTELEQVRLLPCNMMHPGFAFSYIAACQHSLNSHEEKHACLDSKHQQALWTKGQAADSAGLWTCRGARISGSSSCIRSLISTRASLASALELRMTSACRDSRDPRCWQLWELKPCLWQKLRPGCDLQGIQELQSHIAALQSEPSPLEAARAELAACEGDRAKFLRLLEQLQARPSSSSMPPDPLCGSHACAGPCKHELPSHPQCTSPSVVMRCA